MSNLSGQMATAVMLAVLLAAGIAWVIATLYRRKMLALMRGAPGLIAAGAVMAAGSAAPAVAAPSPTLDHAANRRAMRLLLVVLTAVCLAVAPYLLPFALVLTGISHLALGMLAENVQASGAWLAPLLAVFGATGTIALIAVAPWLLAAWPIHVIGRGLAVAYRRKRVSDLGYLFSVYWFVILLANAIPATAEADLAGAPAERFRWLEAGGMNTAKAREVLASLFAA